MTGIRELRGLLDKIVGPGEDRQAAIKQFQQIVWNSQEDGESWEVLVELACDLDYFEPDDYERTGDPSFFGEERLLEEVRHALDRLNAIEKQED